MWLPQKEAAQGILSLSAEIPKLVRRLLDQVLWRSVPWTPFGDVCPACGPAVFLYQEIALFFEAMAVVPGCRTLLHLLLPWLGWLTRMNVRRKSANQIIKPWNLQQTTRSGCHAPEWLALGYLNSRAVVRLWRRAVALDPEQEDQRGATEKSHHKRQRTLTDSCPPLDSSSFLRPRCIYAFGLCETHLYLYNTFLFAASAGLNLLLLQLAES